MIKMSEIDECMQNWRTDKIVEYARAEADKIRTQKNMTEIPEVVELEEDIAYKQEQLKHIKQTYLDKIFQCEQVQTDIKAALVDGWKATEEKTFECDAGTATLRTTKSLNIRDKEKLVAFLELNKKLTDFIKSFEITKLRKIKDAGMLGDDIATYDEKKSIAIQIAEADQ